MGKKLVLGGLAGLVLLVLSVGLLARYFRASVEALEVVEAHVQAIRNADYARAYGHLSSDKQKKMSLEEFQFICEQNQDLLKNTEFKFGAPQASGQEITFRGTVTRGSRDVARVRYTLVKEGNRWRLRDFFYERAAD